MCPTLSRNNGFSQVKQLVELEPGGLSVQVVSVSREYRNTLEHTGLMCWESSLPLARFLLAAPSLLQGALQPATPTLLVQPLVTACIQLLSQHLHRAR